MEEKIIYKTLPSSFEGRASQKEFSFTQLKREKDIALYEKKDKKSALVYYEVVIIRRHEGRTMPGGVKIEPAEFYPSDAAFGQYGWCFNDKERAEDKFTLLSIS